MRVLVLYGVMSCLPTTDGKPDVISLSGPGNKFQAGLGMIVFDGIIDGLDALFFYTC